MRSFTRRQLQEGIGKLCEAGAYKPLSSAVLDERLDELFFAAQFDATGAPTDSTVRGVPMRTFLAIGLGVVLSMILFVAEGFFVFNFTKGGQVTQDALFSK